MIFVNNFFLWVNDMSYTCTLYINSSNPNVISKSISGGVECACDFKKPVDVENPTIYINAGASYDTYNYVYIPEFGRYYFAKAIAGTSNTLTFECISDPLMSFAAAIKASKAVIARNPWVYNKYIHDPKLPIEARTVTETYKFPVTETFKGRNNTYILTTIGSGGSAS